MKTTYTVKRSDIGKTPNDDNMFEPLGRVLEKDVGKVLSLDEFTVWHVENDAQRQARLMERERLDSSCGIGAGVKVFASPRFRKPSNVEKRESALVELETLLVDMAVTLILSGHAGTVVADLYNCKAQTEAVRIASRIVMRLPDDKVADFMFAMNRVGKSVSS